MCISTVEIERVIKGVLFEDILSIVGGHGVELRTLDGSDLYLLVAEEKKSGVEWTDIQVECNGLIFEKETNKMVCMAQNKMREISCNEILKEITKGVFTMEYCEDGTVIRVYNYKNEWMTATSKCIDARKSYWSSEKTFNEMFLEIFEGDGYEMSDLDVSYTYTFIIIHKENRIVVSHKENSLIYVSRVNNITREEDLTNDFNFRGRKEIIHKDLNVMNDLNEYYIGDKRGIIIKSNNDLKNKWEIFSYDFMIYAEVKEIRGNVRLIRMRYLELLNDQEKLEKLVENYPENLMVFCMIKHCMNKLYREIHNLYFESHIKHSITVDDSNPLNRTIRQLHGVYKKQKTIITLEVVIERVNRLNSHVIKNLLGWKN